MSWIDRVSFTHHRTLERCEQKFSYRYEEGLKPKTKRLPLYKGSWVHQLLEALNKGKDWKKLHAKIKREQWNKLFDEEKEIYGEETPNEVFKLLSHYEDHYAKQRKWNIWEVEKYYSFPTNVGLSVVMKVDMLIKLARNAIGLVETKTHKKLPSAKDRFLHPQAHSYAFILKKLGVPIQRIIFNYIRTEPVPSPRMLKKGKLSERKIETDKPTFLAALKKYRLNPTKFKKRLKDLPDTVVLQRKEVSPNFRIGKHFVTQWIVRRMEYIKARKSRKPLLSFNHQCTWDCEYYDLCIIDMLGRDRKAIIKIKYEKERK